jgi:NADH:ubiquinone oxidoreductase subunit H
MILYLIYLCKCLIVVLSVLIAIAYLTAVERKVMGSMQRRLGPSSVGFYGTLQPFADALKLFLKEVILPVFSNRNLFLAAPLVTLALSFMGWAVIPFGKGVVISDFSLGILFLLSVSSLGIYGVVFSGWAANSKYSLMGSLRSTAQMISYEVALSLLILCVIFCSGTTNLTLLSEAQKCVPYLIPLSPVALMFYISMLAETNRAPFDLPEAESELVAGFFTEHSAFPFAYFFLGEYGNMILISALGSFLFLGGYLPYLLPETSLGGSAGALALGLKIGLLLFGFVWVRATFPRFRYDQLMSVMWKSFLPLGIGYVLFVPGMIIALTV